MMINWVTYIGLSAAVLTTAAFLPQVLKVFKTKKTRDISLPMYTILSFGISLWLVYGFLLRDIPLIIANSVTLVLAASVLMLKIRYG